ncbi:MAG: M13 family metallopeptidase [Bryobacterales bacterium]|nr:M13 family metallopeptidase [Bryobacterales bacterium]MBV9401307.1 M13 family metallopeptidase [Bryobacterales bacterium]
MRVSSCFVLFIVTIGLTGQSPQRSGIHPEDMDSTCKPCTDFWRYVNGGWMDKNPIPARASSWGPFSILTEANQERTRTILEAAAADNSAERGSNLQKMGDFYASCMDTAAIDARGIAPLQPDFDRIAAIHSIKDLNDALISFQKTARPFGAVNGAVVGAFRLTSGQDPKNPSRVVARIVERDGAGRSGTSILSLPDRDYYFKTDEKSRNNREAFVAHAAKVLELTGTPREEAARQGREILAFETKLAEPVMPIAAKRDPEATYHPMGLAELRALAPDFDWPSLLREVGLPESTPINVAEPELVKKFNSLLTEETLDTWRMWLRWRTLKLAAPYLAKPFADEDFHFERTVLAGVQEQEPRWQTCSRVLDRDLSDALGEAYVAKYFPPEAKRRMSELVENLRAAMRDELDHSEWMQPATKKNAVEKLNALRVQIGYPDKWRDYSSLEIKRNTFFENVRAAWINGQQYEISKIGKPLTRNDWTMTPPTVNAYSSAGQVVVVFPAGILQPPFFDMQSDDAANYGAIGAVIGHEIGHQFDDGGSKYDSTGALNNWWTEDDRKKFDARTACVVDQFNTLDVGDGLRHNGKQVLGEALGDLGGLTVAYRAYQRSLGGKPGPVLDGFTADQRFFISFARVWGTQYRPEAMRLQLNTNNHPVSQYRALATLQNMPEFHRAFQCKTGDPMVRPPARQCKLW